MSSEHSETTKEQETQRESLMAQLRSLGQMDSTETALFHQVAAAKYGLGVTDIKTLTILQQEGSMTAGQLAIRLSFTTGAVTNVVDRLERRELVKRQPDPEDRRKVIVVLNEEKLTSGENVYRSIGESFHDLFKTYTIEQLEFLVRYHKDSIRLTKHETSKLLSKKVARLQ